MFGSGNQIGGICGANNGTIIACYVAAAITGGQRVGGLCGDNEDGTISVSYTVGQVGGTSYVGGVCGYNRDGRISHCFATGSVSGGKDVGGFVGISLRDETQCSQRCWLEYWWPDRQGHICPMWGGCWEQCRQDCGAVLVVDSGLVASSFWDTQSCGASQSCGGQGKTTAEMKMLSTFTDAGWDFVGESTNGRADTWRMCVDGVDYPCLSWEFSDGGDSDCPDGVALDDLLYLAGRWLATTPEGIGAADATADGAVDMES